MTAQIMMLCHHIMMVLHSMGIIPPMQMMSNP